MHLLLDSRTLRLRAEQYRSHLEMGLVTSNGAYHSLGSRMVAVE
jgi:hypothetical protein